MDGWIHNIPYLLLHILSFDISQFHLHPPPPKYNTHIYIGKLKGSKSVSPEGSIPPHGTQSLPLRHNSLNCGPNDSFSDDDDELLRHLTAHRSSDESSDLKSRFNRSWIKYVILSLLICASDILFFFLLSWLFLVTVRWGIQVLFMVALQSHWILATLLLIVHQKNRKQGTK